TGRPAFTPKWSLGYSGSTMTYTDSPNAQERMNEFLTGCEKHDILCDSFHLSSGYTSIGEKRYVFNWDRAKFPDPEGFVKHYLDAGVKVMFDEAFRVGEFRPIPVKYIALLTN